MVEGIALGHLPVFTLVLPFLVMAELQSTIDQGILPQRFRHKSKSSDRTHPHQGWEEEKSHPQARLAKHAAHKVQ